MKRYFLFTVIYFSLYFTGCYTQFVSLDRDDAKTTFAPDSSAQREAQETDTVVIRDREICYWTNDFWGYPVMRCYESYYSRNWFAYNRSPWWYRHDPYWYDYGHCPRYYYYDHSCGCCRYYHGDYYPNSSGGSGTSGTSSGSRTRRSRSQGIPYRSAPSPSSTGNALKSQIPSGNSSQPDTTVVVPKSTTKSGVSRGPVKKGQNLLNAHNPKVVSPPKPTNSSSSRAGKTSEKVIPKTQSKSPKPSVKPSSQSDTTRSRTQKPKKRRNPRNW